MTVVPASELPAGRLLALDLGEVRIGVAVSDELGMLASPLTVLRRQRTRAEDFAAIIALVQRERAVGVLVGIPFDRDGEVGAQARWVQRYAGRLAAVLPVPLAFWDESHTTGDAAALMRESGGRTPLDAAAAAVLLRDFLATRHRTTEGA